MEELFEPGQLLVCKVKEVVKSTIKLTVDPKQVNSSESLYSYSLN